MQVRTFKIGACLVRSSNQTNSNPNYIGQLEVLTYKTQVIII